jgi:hypothetical protein
MTKAADPTIIRHVNLSTPTLTTDRRNGFSNGIEAACRPDMVSSKFIEQIASHETGREPVTVQDVVRRRLEIDRQILTTLGDEPRPGLLIWRLAWLRHRQALLIPSLISDERIVERCFGYSKELRSLARQIWSDTPDGAEWKHCLRPLLERSLEFWRALDQQLQAKHLGDARWLRRDVDELLWIRFGVLYISACITRERRWRSRRELAQILCGATVPRVTPNSVRLRLLPRIEADMKTADAWAAGEPTEPESAD